MIIEDERRQQTERIPFPRPLPALSALLAPRILGHPLLRPQIDPALCVNSPFQLPALPSIPLQRYITRLMNCLHNDWALLVVALVLIDRLNHRQFKISAKGVHRLLATALLVGAKACSDFSGSSSEICQAGGLSGRELQRLQLQLLQGLEWQVQVGAAQFFEMLSKL